MNNENGSPRGQPGYGDRGTQSQSQGQSQSQSQPKSSSDGSRQDEGEPDRRTPETEPTIADYGGQGPAGDGKDENKDGGTRPRDYENPPRDQQGQQPGADLAKAQEQGPLDK
ncbi:hypothetical protein [Qipengyuania sp.]|uniref:hypothetical protein n=1 Tax=Qipengyuania sp. TaxID=2004515 RepID=UPI0035C7CAEB